MKIYALGYVTAFNELEQPLVGKWRSCLCCSDSRMIIGWVGLQHQVTWYFSVFRWILKTFRFRDGVQCTLNFHVGVLSICTVRTCHIYFAGHRKRWWLDRDWLLPLEALNGDLHYAVEGFSCKRDQLASFRHWWFSGTTTRPVSSFLSLDARGYSTSCLLCLAWDLFLCPRCSVLTR